MLGTRWEATIPVSSSPESCWHVSRHIGNHHHQTRVGSANNDNFQRNFFHTLHGYPWLLNVAGGSHYPWTRQRWNINGSCFAAAFSSHAAGDLSQPWLSWLFGAVPKDGLAPKMIIWVCGLGLPTLRKKYETVWNALKPHWDAWNTYPYPFWAG